jgi:hypothetical protein
MSDSVIARPYYPSEPTDPKYPPVDPTSCPTCRSGVPTTEPTYEEAILVAEY